MCPGFPDECTDSEHGTCVNGTCQCGDNWRGSDCSVVRCPGAEENCNGRGRCDSSVEPAECRCDARWTGPDCATRTVTHHAHNTQHTTHNTRHTTRNTTHES